MPKLIAHIDTIAKASTAQSSTLPEAERWELKSGEYPIKAYMEADQHDRYAAQVGASAHVVVTFENEHLGRNTWLLFAPHIEVEGNIEGNNPVDPARPEVEDRGIPLQLPNHTGTYYSNVPILSTNRYGKRGNFTWGEALHVNPVTGAYRAPAHGGVVRNIIKVADVLEEIRRMYGDRPLKINSWYRDPATNRAVGGASQSRHLSGDAVDFVIQGVKPMDAHARLSGWWGGRGGLASSSVFTHIDCRGYRARWSYGF